MKKEKFEKNIICECGYQNIPENVAKYGVCRGCGKIIDKKVYFERVMSRKLHIKRRGFKRWV